MTRTITINNGRKLPLFQKIEEDKNTSYQVSILSLQDQEYFIMNNSGLTAKIHKSLLKDNHIEIIDNKAILTQCIYEKRFYNKNVKISPELERKLFADNFNHLFEMRELIYSDSRFFLCEVDYVSVGSFNEVSLPLGLYFESIERNELTKPCSDCGGESVIFQGIGPTYRGAGCSYWYCTHCDSVNYDFAQAGLFLKINEIKNLFMNKNNISETNSLVGVEIFSLSEVLAVLKYKSGKVI